MLGFTAPASAELTPGGKRVALVVGNGHYQSVDRLPNAPNDARLIASTLKSLGFTLVGDGPQIDLDRAHLSLAVQEFGRALMGAEVGLFYYSGHGLQVQGVNWLVPIDANPSRPQDLDFQMVDADLVLRQMDGAGTRLNIVLLDACRNNPFALRGLRAIQSGLAEMRAPEGTLISYATQPGAVAADGAGSNSPYTTALAANMKKPGLDIFRLFNQVGLQVKRATGGSQQPWVSSSPIDGDFYFAEPPAAVPPRQAVVAATQPIVPMPQPAAPVSQPAPPVPQLPEPLPAQPAVAAAQPAAPAPLPVAPAPQLIEPAPTQPSLATTQFSMPAPQPAEPAPQAAEPAPMQMAGLVRPPEPVLSPAPPLAPIDPVERLRALAQAERCAVLDVHRNAGEIVLTGLAVPGSSWDAMLRQAQAGGDRGVMTRRLEVEMLPAFACEVLTAFSLPIRQARAEGGGTMLVLPKHEYEVRDQVSFLVRGGAGKNIAVDVFRPGRSVEHIRPLHVTTEGEDARVVLPPATGNARGPRLLAVLLGNGKLPSEARPPLESTEAYLAAVGTAIPAEPDLRADLATFVLRMPPPAVAPTQAAAGSSRPGSTGGGAARCARILERAQLGETLSETDRLAMASQCR